MTEPIFDFTKEDWVYLGIASWVYTHTETKVEMDALCLFYINEKGEGVQKLRMRGPSGDKFILSRSFEPIPNHRELILREFEMLQSLEMCFNPELAILIGVKIDNISDILENILEFSVIKKLSREKTVNLGTK